MSNKNDGKYLEEATRDALKELAKTLPIKIERIDDAKSAGRFTTNKAGDFMGSANGVPWLLECKSSIIDESLRNCLSNTVKNTQVAHHRLWHRAKGSSIFIFHSDSYDRLEIWDGPLVCAYRVSGKPLPKDGEMFVTGLDSLGIALKEVLL